VQLRHLYEGNERRRDADHLRGLEQITLPPMGSKGIFPVIRFFPVGFDDRDRLAEHLAANGIDNAVHCPIPIHL